MRWFWVFVIVCSLPVSGPVQGQEFTTLKGHGGPIMGLAVSPEGQVATASFDNSVGLWTDRAPQWLEGHAAAVIALNFDAAPVLISGGDDFRVLMWHPEQSEPFEIAQHKGKISAIAVDNKFGRIATASWDGSLQLLTQLHVLGYSEWPPFDFDRQDLLGHRSNVTDVAFTPSGGLFSASSDGTIRVWEGPSSDPQSRVLVKHGFGINELVVTDHWIAYGAVDGGTRVIDPDTGDLIADFTLDRRPILAMAYHAASGQIAVGDGHGYIMMLDANTWSITRDFKATRNGPVWALAFSPDGQTLYAGGLDDVAYAWPVSLLGEFDPAIDGQRSFLRDVDTMPNGERQFMRKCSICHALEPGPSRKAGPTLHNVFGRKAGTVADYRYSETLDGSDIIWSDDTINALFEEGPDHYIPGSKMPMQVIAGSTDRADLITFLKHATTGETVE